jgi:hypothetical protein
VNEIAHRVFGDAAIRHHIVGAAIARNDTVKDTRMRRTIELNEELSHWRSSIPNSQNPTSNHSQLPTPKSQSRSHWELGIGSGWELGVGNWQFYLGEKGCLALFEPEITSSMVGFLPSARAIDSFVAW